MAASGTQVHSPRRDAISEPPRPIGVFWDIENCQVPRGKSALALVQRIRDRFFSGHREAEFMCVCDTSKEKWQVIQELNYAQVTVVHIHAISKNAADDKLRQALRRFANAYAAPATAVLLSGDVNFASELSDLRYRHHHRVVLVYSSCAQEALINCAHQSCSFDELVEDLPDRGTKTQEGASELLVSGLPRSKAFRALQTRLNQLSENCGGRVLSVSKSCALLGFPNPQAAARAKKRLSGQDVYGAKILVDFAISAEQTSAAQAENQDSESSRPLESQNSTNSPPVYPAFYSPKPCHRVVEQINRAHSLSPNPHHGISNQRPYHTRYFHRSLSRGSQSPSAAPTQNRGQTSKSRLQKSRSCDNSEASNNVDYIPSAEPRLEIPERDFGPNLPTSLADRISQKSYQVTLLPDHDSSARFADAATNTDSVTGYDPCCVRGGKSKSRTPRKRSPRKTKPNNQDSTRTDSGIFKDKEHNTPQKVENIKPTTPQKVKKHYSSSNSTCEPVPDAGSTQDESVPDTGSIPIPDTESIPIPDTGSIPIPDTESIPIPDTGSIPIPDTGSIPIPDTGSIQIPDTGSIQIPDTGSIQIPDTKSIPIPDTGSIPIPDTGSIPIPDTGSIQIPDTGSIQIPDTKSIPIPDTESILIPDTESIPVPDTESIPVPNAGTIQIPDHSRSIQIPDTGTIQIPDHSGSIQIPDAESIQISNTQPIQISNTESIQIKNPKPIRPSDKHVISDQDPDPVLDPVTKVFKKRCRRRRSRPSKASQSKSVVPSTSSNQHNASNEHSRSRHDTGPSEADTDISADVIIESVSVEELETPPKSLIVSPQNAESQNEKVMTFPCGDEKPAQNREEVGHFSEASGNIENPGVILAAEASTASPYKMQKPRPLRPKYPSPAKYQGTPKHLMQGKYPPKGIYGGHGNQFAPMPYQYATPPNVRKYNHYRHTTWRDSGGYYSHFGYPPEHSEWYQEEQWHHQPGHGQWYHPEDEWRHQDNPEWRHQADNAETGDVGEIRDVVDRFSRGHKITREVLLLQQQIYQEDQWPKGEGNEEADHLQIHDEMDMFSRNECHSAPPLNYYYKSPPDKSYHAYSPHRSSPRFRRTPGARRPNSRGHYSDPGARPGSAMSNHSNTSYGSYGTHGGYGGGYNEDTHFQPIRTSPVAASEYSEEMGSEFDYTGDQAYTELMVSNLDYNISAREWKKILYAEFHQHVQVLGVYIQTQPDNTNVGFIKVPTDDDARFAVSQFHRKKIGYKRIHVTVVNQDENAAANTKNEVIGVLQEVPNQQLSLYKLMELFENRYQRPVTVSELYSFQDVLEIRELEGLGRVVKLISASEPPNSPQSVDMSMIEPPEAAVCLIHCPEGSAIFQEVMESSLVPFVTIQLKSFAAQVHTLLQGHEGCVPFASFAVCYRKEFGTLRMVSHGGVPLEHLVTCVPGVKVAVMRSGIKKVMWAENKPPSPVEQGRFCSSPLLNQQLIQFSREVVELLKHTPQCRLPFNKFIPTYHHTLGRQCRVADYGYTKLIELFNAIPHVVQVIGVGVRKYVTLTHRAQMKRFTMDMTRVLKSQASKQVSVLDLPIVFNKVLGKQFDITEYGLCYLEDVLSELPDNVIAVSGIGEEMVLSIPKRDQTAEEKEATRQFALEVVDLLKHCPQARMPFNRFIPAYHHHFGKQCRVSDYGFTKLLELFEAIPQILKIVDEDEEKVLTLVESELLKILEEQVTGLLKSCPDQRVPVPEFLSTYTKFYGYSLHLTDYGVTSVVKLMEKLNKTAKVESQDGKFIIKLVDNSQVEMLAHRVLLLLMEQVDGAMNLELLQLRYKQLFGYSFTESEIQNDLEGLVQVQVTGNTKSVKLCPLQLFARDVRSLLRIHEGKLPLAKFENAYANHYGVHLVPASYGFPSTIALLQAVPHVAQIRGRGPHRMVLLYQDFKGKLMTNSTGHEERGASPSLADHLHDRLSTDMASNLSVPLSARRRSPCDLLSTNLPSGVPSPELHPAEAVLTPTDLMRFDPSPINIQDFFCGLSPEEKRGQKTPLCKTPTSDMLQFAAQLLPSDRSNQSPLPPSDHMGYMYCAPPVPSSAQHVTALEQQLKQQTLGQDSPRTSPHHDYLGYETPVNCNSYSGRQTPDSGIHFTPSVPPPTTTRYSPSSSLPEVSRNQQMSGNYQDAVHTGGTLFWMKTENDNMVPPPPPPPPPSGNSTTRVQRLSPAGCESQKPYYPSASNYAPIYMKEGVQPPVASLPVPGGIHYMTPDDFLKKSSPKSPVPIMKMNTTSPPPKLDESEHFKPKIYPNSPKPSTKSSVADRLSGSGPDTPSLAKKIGATENNTVNNVKMSVRDIPLPPEPLSLPDTVKGKSTGRAECERRGEDGTGSGRRVSGASGSTDRSLDGSVASTPSPSHKLTSPRKSRIAAKFAASE